MRSWRRSFLAVFALIAATACGGKSPIAPGDSGNPTGGTNGGSLGGRAVFPPDNPWNQDISAQSVDANSAALIASCGANAAVHPDFGTVYAGAPNGIPYVLVGAAQPRVALSFDYADESDAGPYPIPADVPVEGGRASNGDRHVIVVDTSALKLYELFAAYPVNQGASWHAGSGAVFDLSSNALRPAGWTSADAAGLPIFPGLVRYDEAAEVGRIAHALRFTCPSTREAYVPPARHWASNSTDVNRPPMGMRVRLKASVDIATFPAEVRVILTALKTYGMLMADNGSAFYISGAPDSRWSDDNLHTMSQLHGSDFEVVRMQGMVVP